MNVTIIVCVHTEKVFILKLFYYRFSPERKYSPTKDTQQTYETEKTSQKPKKYEVSIEIPASKYTLRPSRSAENLEKLADDLPNVSVQEIKERLFGPNASSRKVKKDLLRPTQRDEHEKEVGEITEKVKVESMKGLFSAPIQSLPTFTPVYTKQTTASSGDDGGKDELLYTYASYRDTPNKKRLNIFDDLTDLEATYERMNMTNEDINDNGGLRDFGNAPANEYDPLEPNVKRLSISNVRKFEEMLEKKLGEEQGTDRTKQWLSFEVKQSRSLSSGQGQKTSHSREKVSPSRENVSPARYYHSKMDSTSSFPGDDTSTVFSDGGSRLQSGRLSLPRKKADDMAYRKTHQQASLHSASTPMFWTTANTSYLGNNNNNAVETENLSNQASARKRSEERNGQVRSPDQNRSRDRGYQKREDSQASKVTVEEMIKERRQR